MNEDPLRALIDRVPALRRVVKSRAGQHLVQTVRAAGAVQDRGRFAINQLGPPRTAGYRLRESGLHIFLRHDGGREGLLSDDEPSDVIVLIELFGHAANGHNAYEPPKQPADVLRAKKQPKVLDLGGNIGLFGAYALSQWPNAVIHSFEPDPTNLRLLERVVAANKLENRWSITDAAVANYNGEMHFASALGGYSHVVTGPSQPATGDPHDLNGREITVRTVDIFEQDTDVDLLKIDIEGGEWPILTDPRAPSLKAEILVLEWHAHACPDPDARSAAVALLRNAGYDHVEDVESGTVCGVLWAWREPEQPA